MRDGRNRWDATAANVPSVATEIRRWYTLAATRTDAGIAPCRIVRRITSRTPKPAGTGTAMKPTVHAAAYAATTSVGFETDPKLASKMRYATLAHNMVTKQPPNASTIGRCAGTISLAASRVRGILW